MHTSWARMHIFTKYIYILYFIRGFNFEVENSKIKWKNHLFLLFFSAYFYFLVIIDVCCVEKEW